MSDLLKTDQIAEVIRYHDAESEEFEDMPRFWAQRGIDVSAVVHAADQRSLRLIMMERGQSPNMSRPEPVAYTREESVRKQSYMLAWMDALATGIELAKAHPEILK